MMKTIPAPIERDLRLVERLYARSCILTSWVICALLTAVFAWMLRQPPFSFPPIAVQMSALTVNALCWWLCTTRIWFRVEHPRNPATARLVKHLKRLSAAAQTLR